MSLIPLVQISQATSLIHIALPGWRNQYRHRTPLLQRPDRLCVRHWSIAHGHSHPGPKIVHKLNRRFARTIPNPHVDRVFWGLLRFRQVTLLRLDEGPNLIDLDSFAGKILKDAVLVGITGFTRVHKKFYDVVLANVCCAGCGTNAHAFD